MSLKIEIYVITIILAVIVSIVLHQIWNRIPLTIIQILLGSLLGLTPIGRNLEIDPEVFIFLIIVPLLYIEGERTDILALWKTKLPIINMAFLSVFVTVFAIGVFTHLLFPFIPFAACFALGAILGPTDMTAVTSLSDKIQFSKKNLSLLKGEGLINDASGVTALGFAVLALLTGNFSPTQAVSKLVLTCLGGIAVGYILANVKRRIMAYLEKHSVDNIVIYILIEVIMPFLCYIVAEEFGVSGILSVVVAGCIASLNFKKATQFEAEFDATKNIVWNVMITVLESLAFLFLGLQLPGLLLHVNDSNKYNIWFLTAAIFMIYLVLFMLRFICAFLFTGKKSSDAKERRTKLKDSIIISLSGVKGAICLAAAFSLPNVLSGGEVFEAKSILLFITVGIIMISLLSALILLPLIAESGEKDDTFDKMQLAVLKEVIKRLKMQKPEDMALEYNSVILNYQERIRNLEDKQISKKERKEIEDLRHFSIELELISLNEAYKKQEISDLEYKEYSDMILKVQHFESRKKTVQIRVIKESLKRVLFPVLRSNRLKKETDKKKYMDILDIFIENNKLVIDSLDHLRNIYSDKAIDRMIFERMNLQHMILDGHFLKYLKIRLNSSYGSYLLTGYEIEREVIREFEKSEKLTLEQANRLRRNVNGLESFVISDEFNFNIYQILDNKMKLQYSPTKLQ